MLKNVQQRLSQADGGGGGDEWRGGEVCSWQETGGSRPEQHTHTHTCSHTHLSQVVDYVGKQGDLMAEGI